MIEKIKHFWNNYGYEFIAFLSLSFIIFLAIKNRGKKGTWNVYNVVVEKPKKVQQDSSGEIECRRVMEKIFNAPFDKARPDILKNPVTSTEQNVNNLELDCYNAELKLAVEYNGIQHYKYIPYFHKSPDSFQNQKYRDYIKREICAKNGIRLIEVPYTVKINEIESFIREKLSSLNINGKQ